MTALKSAINCENKASLQSAAIKSKHNHLNFSAPQLQELCAPNYHSSAGCEMTSQYVFILLPHLALNCNINWSDNCSGATCNEYVI